MNVKRAMYSERVEHLCSEGFELLMLYPRSTSGEYDPPPMEELERIRAEVGRVSRMCRVVDGPVKRRM